MSIIFFWVRNALLAFGWFCIIVTPPCPLKVLPLPLICMLLLANALRFETWIVLGPSATSGACGYI